MMQLSRRAFQFDGDDTQYIEYLERELQKTRNFIASLYFPGPSTNFSAPNGLIVGAPTARLSSLQAAAPRQTRVPQIATREQTETPQAVTRRRTPAPQIAAREPTETPQAVTRRRTPAPQIAAREPTETPQAVTRRRTPAPQVAAREPTETPQAVTRRRTPAPQIAAWGKTGTLDSRIDGQVCPPSNSNDKEEKLDFVPYHPLSQASSTAPREESIRLLDKFLSSIPRTQDWKTLETITPAQIYRLLLRTDVQFDDNVGSRISCTNIASAPDLHLWNKRCYQYAANTSHSMRKHLADGNALSFRVIIVILMCTVMLSTGVSIDSVDEVMKICVGDYTNRTMRRYRRAAKWVNEVISMCIKKGWGSRSAELFYRFSPSISAYNIMCESTQSFEVFIAGLVLKGPPPPPLDNNQMPISIPCVIKYHAGEKISLQNICEALSYDYEDTCQIYKQYYARYENCDVLNPEEGAQTDSEGVSSDEMSSAGYESDMSVEDPPLPSTPPAPMSTAAPEHNQNSEHSSSESSGAAGAAGKKPCVAPQDSQIGEVEATTLGEQLRHSNQPRAVSSPAITPPAESHTGTTSDQLPDGTDDEIGDSSSGTQQVAGGMEMESVGEVGEMATPATPVSIDVPEQTQGGSSELDSSRSPDRLQMLATVASNQYQMGGTNAGGQNSSIGNQARKRSYTATGIHNCSSNQRENGSSKRAQLSPRSPQPEASPALVTDNHDSRHRASPGDGTVAPKDLHNDGTKMLCETNISSQKSMETAAKSQPATATRGGPAAPTEGTSGQTSQGLLGTLEQDPNFGVDPTSLDKPSQLNSSLNGTINQRNPNTNANTDSPTYNPLITGVDSSSLPPSPTQKPSSFFDFDKAMPSSVFDFDKTMPPLDAFGFEETMLDNPTL